MEAIETKKTDYYLTDEEIEILFNAYTILDRLADGGSLSMKDYRFTSFNTNLKISGEDLLNCHGTLDALVNYLLEDNHHITKVKSLKDFEEYYGFNIDYTTI